MVEKVGGCVAQLFPGRVGGLVVEAIGAEAHACGARPAEMGEGEDVCGVGFAAGVHDDVGLKEVEFVG